MSIQAGIWNFHNEPADRQFLRQISQATAQYGPDGEGFYVNDSFGMLYRPFHTTRESCNERQPYVSSRSNNVITWDGRLDNREELIPQLDGFLADDRTDVAIAAAAFDKWGTEGFARLLTIKHRNSSSGAPRLNPLCFLLTAHGRLAEISFWDTLTPIPRLI